MSWTEGGCFRWRRSGLASTMWCVFGGSDIASCVGFFEGRLVCLWLVKAGEGGRRCEIG